MAFMLRTMSDYSTCVAIGPSTCRSAAIVIDDAATAGDAARGMPNAAAGAFTGGAAPRRCLLASATACGLAASAMSDARSWAFEHRSTHGSAPGSNVMSHSICYCPT